MEVISKDTTGRVILVWTPDHSNLVIPEELEGDRAMAAVNRGRSQRIEADGRSSRKWFVWGSLLAAAWIAYEGIQAAASLDGIAGMERWLEAGKAVLFSLSTGIVLLLWFALAFLPFYQSWSWQRTWLAGSENSKALIPTLKFETWMDLQRAPVTRVLTALLLLTGFFQWWLPELGVEAAGLVKARYHAGEHWRLLTAPWLHGNVMHLFFNAMALLYLGKRVELFARWPHLLNVLLLASLGGGLLSAQLIANSSIGISGGLMGWLGFLLVFETRHQRLVTRSARRRLLAGLLLIAVMGAIGYRFIDNAAHAGGLVTGIVYASIVFPGSSSIHRPRILGIDRLVGGFSGFVLVVGLGFALLRLWQA
ncbi:MAG: rhomboid family intramembrane serine protease [Akkermansiaceae bacterium]|nr:rhomboid family intramembrane serine protease [Akkermansiaceae bacterium]